MLKIHSTTNYEQFHFFKGNRLATLESVPKALLESIQQKNMLESHPILVDRDFYVVDGQNRLRAAEKLGLPIFYVIDEKIEEQDIPLCQIQKNWTIANYLGYYKESNADYEFLYDISERYHFRNHIPFLIRHSYSTSTSATSAFRKGKFKISKDRNKLKKTYERIAEIRDEIVRHKPGTYISGQTLEAFWSLVNDQNYEHENMMYKIEKNIDNVFEALSFKKKNMILEILKTKVYNYFNKKDKKLEV